MGLKPVSPTAKAPGQEFTGDVYVNPVHRGGTAPANHEPQFVQTCSRRATAFPFALSRFLKY
jgi:hypothetical protein